MPEGDTLFRTAETLRAVLLGRTVVAARGRPGGARLELLAGRTIDAVAAHGKHLLLEASGGLTLHTHLGMHGSWHRYREGESWRRSPAGAVAVVEVPGAVAVCFAAPTVELIETRSLTVHPVLSRLGPDLLSSEQNLDEAVARLRAGGRESLPIADALLDQQALAGIGNVYRSEVCFLERVDPFAPLEWFDDATLARVVATARRLLGANVRGPLRNTLEPDMVGPGRRGGGLWVYRRAGRPCRRCGTVIRSRATGPLARRVYWCPSCQLPFRSARRTP